MIAVELGLGIAVGAGSTPAANAAALLMAGAAAAQLAVIAGGRSGAPCACFGAKGKVGKGSAGRATLLAAAFALAPILPRTEPSTDELARDRRCRNTDRNRRPRRRRARARA